MKDVLVEPTRSILIPGFETLRELAMENGAVGFGISGSGPSIFALCEGKEIAETVAQAMKAEYSKTQIPFDIYLSKVNDKGVTLL